MGSKKAVARAVSGNQFGRLCGMAMGVASWALPSTAGAAGIYVADVNGFTSTTAGTIGQYNLDGTVVNGTLISGQGGAFGLAASSTDVYYTDNDNNKVGDYNTSNGSLNASLITISQPTGIAVSGSFLYVVSQADNTVKRYATDGTLLNATAVSGLHGPRQIALLGNRVFVANNGNGTVGEYDLATETAINASFVSGLSDVTSVAVSPDGLDLYVGTQGTGGRVGEYLIATGAAVNASLITNVNTQYLAVSGSSLYVDDFNGSINQYSLSGAAISVPLISDPNGPVSFAVIPEPATLGMMASVFGAATIFRRRKFELKK